MLCSIRERKQHLSHILAVRITVAQRLLSVVLKTPLTKLAVMLIQDEINTAMLCRIQIRTPVSAVTKKDVLLKNSWHGFPTSERRKEMI